MQITNALNNNIRILFNPRVEAFKLFDFLIVKSDDNRYLAQIIEIYDDKFDASQNVAKLKLFYKITENNEVMPYDNFTPNKECEIIKIKQDEIENFINTDKKTFIFATNAKNSCSLNLQYDFFNKNAIVLADKIENSNALAINLAKKLSEEKHSIIIDATGILELEEAKKIIAGKNFRIPLNYNSIDYIFEKCLADASLEFQSIGGAIIDEIKKFAKKQEEGFIPFNSFVRVLLDQYEATPYPELKVLISRIKHYQMNDIFAKTKRDNEVLSKTVHKNPITIIDLSSIDTTWQKAYLDYIINDIEEEIYLISRINDDNFDVDLVNKTYNKRRNIKLIPCVSYNYKKLPSIIQYCKNYILLPSLYQRTDFLNANLALSNLISDGCIVFGENTDNFLYLARDYELEVQEKRKNYRKIALTLVDEEEKSKTDSERLMEELSDLEDTNSNEETIEEEKEDDVFEDIKETTEEEKNDEFQELNEHSENNLASDKQVEEEKVEEETENSIIEEAQVKVEENEYDNEASNEEAIENENPIVEEEEIKIDDNEEKSSFSLEINEDKEETFKDILTSEEQVEEKTEEVQEEENNIENISIQDADIIDFGENSKEETEEVQTEEKIEEEVQEENAEEENGMELSDEELDFFQLAKESSLEYENENENNSVSKENEDINLSEIANNSLDSSFEQIISTKGKEEKEQIIVDENTKIDTDILEAPQKNDLPVFKEEINNDETPEFSVGNIIRHKKYGKGVVTKTLKYEQRQLVQVEFDEGGKKLLDPKIAEITLEQ